MKSLYKNIGYYLFIAGLFCMSIPYLFFYLWSKAAELGTSQAESFQIYHSYLPSFLHEYNVTSMTGLIFSILAIILFSFSMKYCKLWLKIINVVLIIISSLFALLNLLYMM